MKTNFFLTKNSSIYSILGFFALLATSCGSYQNTSYYDNDGVYGSAEKPRPEEGSKANSGYYKDYFSSLNKENQQVFTDVEKYSSYNDTLKKSNTNPNTTEVQNTTGYASWGSNPDNITVNIYNTGWGYNSWYGPNWGYYGGYYGNYWGYNNWYGNYWGYTPSWAWSWGWNSWYGPSWYGYYGYGYYPYGYGYYGSSWGWNNGYLGHTYAHSGGRRNTDFTGTGIGSPNRSTMTNGGRSALGGTRVVGEPSSVPRNYNNTGTPRSNYSPRTNETVSPRPTTPNSNYNNYNTPRSYTPSTPSTPSSPRSYDSPRSYTPSTPRSYDSPRSYSPSGGGSYGGGGGSYGGGGGGRSGGGGGRR